MSQSFTAWSRRRFLKRSISAAGFSCLASGRVEQPGPASLARLNLPRGMAVDPAGNLYIADSGNHRIGKIGAATQVITTVAGTGTRGFSGDGGPALFAAFNEPWSIALDRAGNIYVADTSNLVVRKIDAKTQVVNTVAGTGSNPSSTIPTRNS